MRGNRRALVMVLGMLGCRHAAEDAEGDKPAAAAVTCQAVEAATIEDTVEFTGVIAPPPKLDAIVSSPIAGRVAQVVVEEGDHVAAGQLLAVIEDPALPAGSLEAKAAVEGARAQKLAAEQEVARQDRLVTTGIGARKDLDEAKAKQAAAAADLATANAKLGLAGAQLARREIRAPRAGVVLHLQRKVGESVDGTAATPLAEIADLSVLELHAQTPPAALRPLREGMAATVRPLGFETAIAGTVVRVAPAVDPATMLGVVRIALSNSDGIKVGLKAGEQVVIDHVLGLQDGQPLIAPEKAGAEKTAGGKPGAGKQGDDEGAGKEGGGNDSAAKAGAGKAAGKDSGAKAGGAQVNPTKGSADR
jgi:RND family efflux transporter MFP subunit